jgi:phosphinothricin acetyltransferase
MGVAIRAVEQGDLEAILALWNPIIRETAVTFASVEKTVQSLGEYIAAREAAGRCFLVALGEGGEFLGFATYDQFRGGDGYVHAMEHTIILGAEARGRGVGRALMVRIEAHAAAAGAHTMVAGISGENPGAVGFHAALGYAPVGQLPQSGRKFDRWMDLILMQKIL